MRRQRRIPLDQHPTAAELEEFVYGGLSVERRRAVVAHLLRGCTECNRKMASHFAGVFGTGELPEVAPPRPEDYDEAVDRAFAAVRGLISDPSARTAEQKKRKAVALLATRGLEGLAEAPPDLQGLPLYEA